MAEYGHGSSELGRIHRRNNDIKLFCHFTGFLEGILSSGYLENGEIEPLLAECENFLIKVADGDANDIIQDFEADLAEHQSIADVVIIRASEIDPNCPKSSLNRFLGLCRGIACDARITLDEAQELLRRTEADPQLLDAVGVRQIQNCCVDAVEDGFISELEENEICEAIGSIVGDCYGDTGLAQTEGVANFEEFRLTDIAVDLCEMRIVLTGNFKTRPRIEFQKELEALGATVSKSVSKKTDFIIIGGEASRDWIEMNRGTKLRKAQELRSEAGKPAFVSEGQILRLMAQN
jgi:hypothetical protein